MDNRHRRLGVALLDAVADKATDRVVGQCFQQYTDTGTTWETELDIIATYHSNQAQWAAVVERGHFTEGCQFSNGDLLALTIIELDRPF